MVDVWASFRDSELLHRTTRLGTMLYTRCGRTYTARSFIDDDDARRVVRCRLCEKGEPHADSVGLFGDMTDAPEPRW